MSGAPRSIVHLDLDAFYASVEQRDDPRLRGRPVVVGGHPKRGVVLAASYEARRYGVHSAMPMARAVGLGPIVVVPPRFAAYEEASERVFEILESASPLVEPLSLDEAFLDVGASRALLGEPAAIARRLRERILVEVGLLASAGIAPVKFVAKIASDIAKPNGQKEVRPEEVVSFLAPLKVSRLWGVGPRTEAELSRAGLRTVGDLAARDPASLEARLGPLGAQLSRLSRGEDDRPVVADRERKSIGAEETFAEDLSDPADLRPYLHGQALRVGRRLRRAGLKARAVALKLKLHDFRLVTRQRTLSAPSDDGQELYRLLLELLRESPPSAPVRLCGISTHDLSSAARPQLDLFAGPSRDRSALNEALDRITARFGEEAVTTADLVGPPLGPSPLRGGGARRGSLRGGDGR